MLAIRAALGRLEQARDFEMMDVREVWIETPRRDVRVALDGEVTRMTPPLHYTIRPAALTVVAPPA
jgi:diacylglycerol kinase family enzyme